MISVHTLLGTDYWHVDEWYEATHARILTDGSIRVLRRRRFWFTEQLCFYPGASPDGRGVNQPVKHRVTVES